MTERICGGTHSRDGGLSVPQLRSERPLTSSISNCQETLLQKNQSGRSGNTTVADSFLKHNRHVAAQQNLCPLRDFVTNRSDQLRSGSRDVASQDENLGIEDVQEIHDRGREIFQRPIDDTARALVSLGCGAENGLSI